MTDEKPPTILNEFESAMVAKYPIKADELLVVDRVFLRETDAGLQLVVQVSVSDHPEPITLMTDVQVRSTPPLVQQLQAVTDLSPAAINRRLRRLGLLPAIAAEPSEED